MTKQTQSIAICSPHTPLRSNRPSSADKTAVVNRLVAILMALAILPTAWSDEDLGYPRKSVRDYGALGDGVTDDYAAIQRALDDAGYKCIVFPAGTYLHSQFLNLKASYSCLFAEPGVTLSNTYPGVSGYQNDGIRVGNASARDGGTGTGFNIRRVNISGFHFDAEGRIGIWVVNARDVLVENISGAGVAVVAVGNDADDDCERIRVRNITRTGPTAADWYTVGIFSTVDFALSQVTSNHSVGSQAVAVTNSRLGVVSDIHIDQQYGLHDGIALLDSHSIDVGNFTVTRARKGVVIYSDFQPPDRAYQGNSVNFGRIVNSEIGLHIYTRYNSVRGVKMTGVKKPVVLGTDAAGNTFDGMDNPPPLR